jgi:hypothetical protein
MMRHTEGQLAVRLVTVILDYPSPRYYLGRWLGSSSWR